MSKGDRIHVMSFGHGGNSGDGINKDGNTYTSSWYLNGPDEFLRLIPEHYDPSEVDGCFIIDKRTVLEQSPGFALRAPMCKAMLGEGEIDRFRETFFFLMAVLTLMFSYIQFLFVLGGVEGLQLVTSRWLLGGMALFFAPMASRYMAISSE